MEDEEKVMWDVGWEYLLGVRRKASAEMMSAILSLLDQSGSQLAIEPEDGFVPGMHRQVVWDSLKDLEDCGMIHRARGKSWKVIIVNPKVVRPSLLKGAKLEEVILEFKSKGRNENEEE